MTKIDGGICAAKGFKASGTYCGIKKPAVENPNPDYVHKNDICLVACDVLCNTAAVYTQNKVKGAPILVTKDHLAQSGNKAKAIIANSKNANTCNADGVEKAAKMCQLVADEMGLPAEQVLVASTGVIGQVLPIEPIMTAVPTLVKELDYGKNEEAATAIMTTDTVKKEYAVEFQLDGKTCRLGGMAKGSGMIHPNMATTLNFISTDCAISAEMLQQALSEIVKVTYNCLSIDGDTSTNDMVEIMASGLAGNAEITAPGPVLDTFKAALYEVMANLTRMLAKDGEGASKLVTCKMHGARSEESAERLAKVAVAMGVDTTGMSTDEAADAAIAAVKQLSADVNIPHVCEAMKADEIEVLAKDAMADACFPGNPREATLDDVIELFKKICPAA